MNDLVNNFFLNVLPSKAHGVLFSTYLNDKGRTETVVNLALEDLDSGPVPCTISDCGQNAYILKLSILIYKTRK